MTFSVAARCSDTGMFGAAVCSSSPAVAARCAFARTGVGAVSSQNITDLVPGERCLDLMELGASGEMAIETIVRSTKNIQYRQLMAVDASGGRASFSGELKKIWQIHSPQLDQYVTRAIDLSAAPGYGVPDDL